MHPHFSHETATARMHQLRLEAKEVRRAMAAAASRQESPTMTTSLLHKRQWRRGRK